MRMKWLGVFVLIGIFLFLLDRKLFAQVQSQNYVKNGSFESSFDSWKTNSSGVTFSIVDSSVFEASRSARIDHSKTTSFGIEQTIENIIPSTQYMIQARIRSGETKPEKAFIRVAWYSSLDGSGSQLSTSESPEITGDNTWELISFSPTSHSQARSAKLRIIVQMGTVFVDECKWELAVSETPTPTSVPTPIATPSLIISPSLTSTPSPSQTQYQPDSIIIHEVMTYPAPSDLEWVELFNNSPRLAELRNWYIDDISDGGSAPKPISMDIEPYGYAVIELNSAMFNNAGDSVRLLDSEEREASMVIYSSSRQGFSWGIPPLSQEGFCFQNPTKRAPNGPCISRGEEVLSATTISIKPKQVLSVVPRNNDATTMLEENKHGVTTSPRKTIRSYAVSPVAIISDNSIPSISSDPPQAVVAAQSQNTLPPSLVKIAVSYCTLSIGSILAKMMLS